jgi:hypothetical protein
MSQTRATPATLLLLALAGSLPTCPSPGQEPAPVFQAGPQQKLRIRAEALLRREWTKDLFGGAADLSRTRLQVRPRLELAIGGFTAGVGGEFNWSSDENTVPPAGVARLALLRDNYDSRDARLDLAFGRLELGRMLVLEGGRIPMPIPFTEMIWDRDLRPQGGALTLESRDPAGEQRLGLTLLAARGSHTFDDDGTEMYAASLGAGFAAGSRSRLELRGSFVRWDDVEGMEPMIRRQNRRLSAGGPVAPAFRVVDLVARLRSEGAIPTQLVVDYAWNVDREGDNRGLWLAAVVGSLAQSRGRLEYTYARVDRDATLAAYGADDFFWVTGWEGHRADFGARAGTHSSMHVVGQLQRFKDSAVAAEREHWVKRLRLEVRWAR